MRYNTRTHRPQTFSPVKTGKRPTGHTHQGGPGYSREARSELFLLTVSQFAGESAFYEDGAIRHDRFIKLISELMRQQDFDWLYDLFVWTRRQGNLRTVALVGAVVTVHERLWMWAEMEGVIHTSRELIREVCARADEPGEILAIWTALYGRSIPKPVKRGVADAANRLYTERSYLKYDSKSNAYRFADVLELAHPNPARPGKSRLYSHILDSRFHDAEPGAELSTLGARKQLMATPVAMRRRLLGSTLFNTAGMTWEATAGWLQGEMDAKAWETLIPQMGIFARLRNLRNFDQAGVSDRVAQPIIDQLTDPEEIYKSRLLPMRFLAAYQHAPSLRWAWPLEQALNASLANIPELSGSTLILVDRSGSMYWNHSKHSEMTFADTAAVFGTALAKRCEKATLVQFGSTSRLVAFNKADSVLPTLGKFTDMGGTQTAEAVHKHYHNHGRVVIITDEQTGPGFGFGSAGMRSPSDLVPQTVPLYTWNLAGYGRGHGPSGENNRHTFGGLTDASFRMIPLIEAGQNGTWPWEK